MAYTKQDEVSGGDINIQRAPSAGTNFLSSFLTKAMQQQKSQKEMSEYYDTLRTQGYSSDEASRRVNQQSKGGFLNNILNRGSAGFAPPADKTNDPYALATQKEKAETAVKSSQADYQGMSSKFLKQAIDQSNAPATTTVQPDPADPNAVPQISPAVSTPKYSMTFGPKGMSAKPVSSAADDASSERAKSIVQGMIDGTIPPDISQVTSWKDRSAIAQEAQKRGFNLRKAYADWTGQKTFSKNINSTQQIRLGQAITSVKMGIPQLRQLSDNFKRTGWTPANYVELTAALSGTDPSKRDAATKFITQINLMQDEMAQAFQAGGVPGEKVLSMVEQIFKPLYGNKQLGAALDQVEQNIATREKAITGTGPRMMSDFGGQENDQTDPLEGKVAFNRQTGQTIVRRGGKWQIQR